MTNNDSISLPDKIIEVTNTLQVDSLNEVRDKLILLINELINKDFQALVQLLYRVDVNENKIRLYLNQKTNEDAASVLADLVIERQLEKIKSRETFKSTNKNKTDEEKW